MSKSTDAYRRWEAMYEQAQGRIANQRASIDRLMEAMNIANATLMEIAEDGGSEGLIRTRARKAIMDITALLAPAAAEEGSGEG